MRFFLCAAVLVLALAAFGLPSPTVTAWGRGPAQWLMTKDEERAWVRVETDQEANDFIDLFWARRDPTPGTERNEFKEEFERRVASADRQFRTDRKRGAMADMGRVYIVLGPPMRANRSPERMYQGNRSKRWRSMQFEYDPSLAGSVGVVKPIVFMEDPVTHEFMIDPQLSNAFGTMSSVVDRNVVNPDLTAAPEWALRGGVDAKPRTYQIVETKQVQKARSRITAMAVPVLIDGAKHLTLVQDVGKIQPQSGFDPFTVLQAQAAFQKSDDLGYVFQLCRDPSLDSDVMVAIAISGPAGVMKAPAESMMPEPIRAMPGCSLVRGALPLSDFDGGDYQFTVSIEDPATKQTYNLTQDFKIE